MSPNESAAQSCREWQDWVRAKWTELRNDQSLGAIEDVDSGWRVEWTDTEATCPYCGHVVTRDPRMR